MPILYSFRRCPYAIRTRMALQYAGRTVELREVVLKDKPSAMLEASPKGTVPVLVLPDGQVIDESWDIIQWAFSDGGVLAGLDCTFTDATRELVRVNDFDFKAKLDLYKYADRHPEHSMSTYRTQCLSFLGMLEGLLQQNDYLLAPHPGVVDIAIFPFIRQFAFVDKPWFDQSAYPKLQVWLDHWLRSDVFRTVMQKHSPWCEPQG